MHKLHPTVFSKGNLRFPLKPSLQVKYMYRILYMYLITFLPEGRVLTSILGWDALGHPNQKEVYPIQCILSK